jgi:hypothetical protein
MQSANALKTTRSTDEISKHDETSLRSAYGLLAGPLTFA